MTDKQTKLLQTIKEIASINDVNTCWSVINTCSECDKQYECGLQSPFEKLKEIYRLIREDENNE